jgi:hypothetical protein
MRRVAEWRARLFFRGGSPAEIERMDFFSLRHWGEMAEIEDEAKKKFSARAAANARK